MRPLQCLIFASCFAFYIVAAAVAQDDIASRAEAAGDESAAPTIVRFEVWLIALSPEADAETREGARAEFGDRNSVAQRAKDLEKRNAIARSNYLMASAVVGEAVSIRTSERVPTVQGVNVTQFGTQRQIQFQDVGLSLEVRSRVSSNARLLFEMQLEESRLEASDVAIFEPKDGKPTTVGKVRQLVHSSTVACPSGGAVVVMATDEQNSPHGSPVVVYLTAKVVE